ncbi:tryptophan synthase subunit alpha, partial [Candidatus Bathyarchaeota archaeon]|nr:tryptophan synthase subunit alpha [Candidatus Bathyarchaeota archaeon]
GISMDLEKLFETLKARGEGAHMAHVYYGDPCEDFSIKLIETLTKAGADIIEFGIPFSDPIADGATFQAACERALNAGVTPTKCLEGIKRLRSQGLEAPIILTTYFNIPFTMGLECFLDRAKNVGVQGVLIPDLPIEEAEPIMEMVKKRGLHLILQVAPTTSEERLKRILSQASGFIYLIGLEGVTGSRLRSQKATMRLIKKVKEETDTPIIVGFGISNGDHAESMVSAGADGVVVGSAYARIYAQNLEDPYRSLPEIAKLAQEIKLGCIRGYAKRNY